MDELFVLIRREDGGRVVEYPLSKISGIRWDWQDGGYQRHYASPRLYGYISYKDAKLVDCSGRHEFADCAKVQIVPTSSKKDPYYAGYVEACNHAGKKPEYHAPKHMTKEVVCGILKEAGGTMTRGRLRIKLLELGCSAKVFAEHIKKLAAAGVIELEGSSNSIYQKIILK